MPVTGHTTLLGILGDPLDNARSPELVNRALQRRGLDAVLVPLRVKRGQLPHAMAGLKLLENWRGSIVTMPHKEAIVPFLDGLSPESRLLGACNVVRRNDDGSLSGTVLDGEGFVAGLRAAGHEVTGRNIFMAGAGGAASAIAFALCKYGARRLVIGNRTLPRGEALAARIAEAWPATEVTAGDLVAEDADIVINATPLGMRDGDASPVDPECLKPGMLAADIVIRDAPTPFLAVAQARGSTTHPGLPMLENQLKLLIDFMLPA